jgi:hypothetical protein
MRFARCKLGVLGSAGAAICLAPCGSALSEWNLGQAMTQSPELGFGLVSFLFLERFLFCFCLRSMRLSPLSFGCFHEKTGRSQVDFCGSWNIIVLPPSSRCRHASIRTLEERFVSLGASWAFSVQPVLLSVWRPVVLLFQSGTWARPLTQSPELGFGLVSFLFLERFLFCFCLSLYAAVATVVRLLLCNGS